MHNLSPILKESPKLTKSGPRWRILFCRNIQMKMEESKKIQEKSVSKKVWCETCLNHMSIYLWGDDNLVPTTTVTQEHQEFILRPSSMFQTSRLFFDASQLNQASCVNRISLLIGGKIMVVSGYVKRLFNYYKHHHNNY